MKKRHCIQYVPVYLPVTVVWIYNLLQRLKVYEPFVLTRKTKNPESFPARHIKSLSELAPAARTINILKSKISGVIPLFYRYSKQVAPEVFHIHFGNIAHKLVPLVRRLDVPSLCSFYGSDAYLYPQKKSNRKKLIRLFTGVDKVLVLGPAMRDELLKLGCPGNKISILHLGIDLDHIAFHPRRLKKERNLKFLVASSFVEKKGLDITIRALGRVRDKYDFTVELIGDGPLRAEVMDLIHREKLSDLFTVHGYRSYKFLLEKAGECDVFLQASRMAANHDKEGTPMVFADVMATGMPVISTFHSDIPELVKDGITGYLAAENDVESFTGCIGRLFENTGRLPEFSVNSRRHIEKEFNIKKQSESLEMFYNHLIESRG